jgi:hypothetical protein
MILPFFSAVVASLHLDVGLSRLGGVPKLVVDDAQLGRLPDNPFGFRVGLNRATLQREIADDDSDFDSTMSCL